MPKGLDHEHSFSANDRALIDEAVRRVRASRFAGAADPTAIIFAVSAAVRQGRRDLFGLVKAGSRIG